MELLRADRAAWIKMAEKVTTLKRKADGTLPLNVALDELQTDPSVMFHLMPLPMERAAVQGKPQNHQRPNSDGTKVPPIQEKPKNKGGNKGKGKGKSKPTSKGRMPVELVGLHQQDKAGKRLCYNFNLQRGCDLAAPGAACVRRLGFQHGTAIDAHVTKQVKAPVIRIDLSGDPGQQLLWRILQRFGVQQNSTLADGSRVSKFRPIDDFSESLINVTNSCSETILPMGVDQICAALVKRMQLRPEGSLVCKTIDLRKAYKNLPISEAALRDAYICVLSPTSGQPEAFQTMVLPFGARAAVMGFCRASYAIWRIGVIVFNLHWTVYFDDYFLVAAVHEAKHIDLAQKLLFQLTGWQTSDEKEGGFGSISRILGVQIDLSEVHLGTITVSNVESRVRELTSVIDDILKRGKVTAAEVKALRGRLVFAEAQIFGRLTGVHLKQLARPEGMVGEAAVDSELGRSLVFLRNRVLTGSPRKVLSEVGRVFHLYTDACFEDDMSGVGGVLVSDEGAILSFFSEQVSPTSIDLLNPLKKRGLIFELEALAVLIGTTQLLHPMTLRPCDRVVVFVDNDAVLSRLVSGKRSLKLEQEIFQSILEWEYDASSVVWYERVPSHANIADGPSRCQISGLDVRRRINVDPDDLVRDVVSRAETGVD
eukprot:s900_g16.t1